MLINNNHTDYTDKLQKYQDYVQALEEERRKIQVFERELPLCLELVTQAIETCRQQLAGPTTEYLHGQSECSEQTSSDGPVLEQFIPIKEASHEEDDVENSQEQSLNVSNNESKDSKSSEKASKKSDWLRSVQLWNQTPDPPLKEDSPKKVSVMEVKKNGSGAFHPFKKEKSVSAPPAQVAAVSSSADTGGNSGGGGGDDKGGDSQRKSRRCWSPELHKRFVQALQQLGGSHVATPKQIRELMKVDGLTNDEVKSHLQKYRLHTRRPSPSTHNSNQQAPQFVVVGGIWVPPPEYTSMGTTTASGETSMQKNSKHNGIYAPIASLPHSVSASLDQNQQNKRFRSDERGGSHSNSPTSSSSTHTTTASQTFS